MSKNEISTESASFWSRNRGWLLSVFIPFFIFFACGAGLGWWLIEKDAGRYLRDHGTPEPDSDFYYAAAITGLAFGVAGGALGISGYGCYRLVRKLAK
ncbi:MAG TPA: hypothetical protein V6D17_05350 [Candidatus Obscuribacterales bacterium]